jgi:hypothetical protein
VLDIGKPTETPLSGLYKIFIHTENTAVLI